ARWVEGYALQVVARDGLRVGQMLAVARDGEMPSEARGRDDGFRLSGRLSRSFVNRHAPQIDYTAAVAEEVKRFAVGRPDRIPIHGRVVRYQRRLATRCSHRLNVALTVLANAPKCYALAVRRPIGLHSVRVRDLPLFVRRHVDGPERAVGIEALA